MVAWIGYVCLFSFLSVNEKVLHLVANLLQENQTVLFTNTGVDSYSICMIFLVNSTEYVLICKIMFLLLTFPPHALPFNSDDPHTLGHTLPTLPWHVSSSVNSWLATKKSPIHFRILSENLSRQIFYLTLLRVIALLELSPRPPLEINLLNSE